MRLSLRRRRGSSVEPPAAAPLEIEAPPAFFGVLSLVAVRTALTACDCVGCMNDGVWPVSRLEAEDPEGRDGSGDAESRVLATAADPELLTVGMR